MGLLDSWGNHVSNSNCPWNWYLVGCLVKTCPKCKSNMIIDIVYGFPSEEMSDEADSNKISLGGCCIEPSNPEFKCKSCGEEFGGLDKFLNDEFINDDL